MLPPRQLNGSVPALAQARGTLAQPNAASFARGGEPTLDDGVPFIAMVALVIDAATGRADRLHAALSATFEGFYSVIEDANFGGAREPNAPNERINLPLRAVPFDTRCRRLLLRELERRVLRQPRGQAPAPSPSKPSPHAFEQ